MWGERVINILERASTVQDYALIVGAALFGAAIIGGIFHFMSLGFYAAGASRTQAGVFSGALMAVAVIFIYQKFF